MTVSALDNSSVLVTLFQIDLVMITDSSAITTVISQEEARLILIPVRVSNAAIEAIINLFIFIDKPLNLIVFNSETIANIF